ncbi:hypothetical protein FCULG_00007364 [Fusarium culmorum]|uniref:Uncharacterized protein n=1 Tax=Fusarium culmorum TaxID=5516 RepID=A0A2T4H1W5_FUSCU|nr:hypothetical protein FCULG_00007364 [Fusarium culmorum]
MRIILVTLAHVIGTPSRAMTLRENLAQEALVTTNWDLNDLPGITAALRIGYAVGGWVAFAIHSVGIEIYIRKTSPQYKIKAV